MSMSAGRWILGFESGEDPVHQGTVGNKLHQIFQAIFTQAIFLQAIFIGYQH